MKKWVHVIINTHGSWLHGDVRGFRSRGHRIHSSGDYKHRPPKQEHVGLREFHRQRSAVAISMDQTARVYVLQSFVQKMQLLEHRIIAASTGAQHLHALCELPAEYSLMQREIGKCKQYASHQVREILPGKIWSEGGDYEPIRDKAICTMLTTTSALSRSPAR